MQNETMLYQKMYTHLFSACEDVLDALNHAILKPDMDMKEACCKISDDLLKKLNECEGIFIEAGENS